MAAFYSLLTPYIHHFFVGLVFTVGVELVVLFLMLRGVFRFEKRIIPNKLIFFSGLFASFATLPYVWFILFPLVGYENLLLAEAISETTVVIIEGIFYFFVLKLNPQKAFLCSLVCNAISFVGGLIFLF